MQQNSGSRDKVRYANAHFVVQAQTLAVGQRYSAWRSRIYRLNAVERPAQGWQRSNSRVGLRVHRRGSFNLAFYHQHFQLRFMMAVLALQRSLVQELIA